MFELRLCREYFGSCYQNYNSKQLKTLMLFLYVMSHLVLDLYSAVLSFTSYVSRRAQLAHENTYLISTYSTQFYVILNLS